MKNNIFEYVGVVVPRDGKTSHIYNEEKETTLQEQLNKDIETSIKEKGEVFVGFCGLSHQYVSLLRLLDKLGYNVEKPVKTKREMKVKSTRYAVGASGCFYIQLKTGFKSYVTYQGIDNVINLRQLPRTREEMRNSLELYRYVREQFLKDCKGNGTATRLLYSSSSISQTLYNRQYKTYNFVKVDYRRRGLNTGIEKYIRPCCHSGFCFLSDEGKNYNGSGIVIDNNSLYPYISSTERIPVELCASGKGVPREHRFITSSLYWTVLKVTVSAELKSDGLPCIYPDGGHKPCEKMTMMDVTLTPKDRQLLYENYKITYFRIISYMTFTTSKLMFRKYMRDLYNKKKGSTGIEREYYKMMINGLIGMFGKRPYRTKTVCFKIGKTLKVETIRLNDSEYKKEMEKISGLCYVNAAITSAARYKIIQDIKKNRDRWLYTDTDSIHLKGDDIPDTVNISDEMGDYKLEHRFEKIVYKGQKSYIMVEDGKVVPTISGVPKDTFDGQDIKDIRQLYKEEQTVLRLMEDTTSGELHYVKRSYNLDREQARENLKSRLRGSLDSGYSQALLEEYRKNKEREKEQSDILRKIIIGFKG